MQPIKRWRGQAEGRNRMAAYRDLVWTVATHDDRSADIQEQTRRCLAVLDKNLAEAGTDKTRLVSAQVFLADMTTKARIRCRVERVDRPQSRPLAAASVRGRYTGRALSGRDHRGGCREITARNPSLVRRTSPWTLPQPFSTKSTSPW